ncbi:prolyl oligopeptidase family serine peptidase [Candidatus Neomarinimicrobiota bacterium]
MIQPRYLTIIATVIILAAACKRGDEPDFKAFNYVSADSTAMPYRLHIPDEYYSRIEYPLVVFLHGGAGRGSNNSSQISGGNAAGSHVWFTDANRANYPAFVVAPQLPDGFTRWDNSRSADVSGYEDLVLAIIEELVDTYSIDEDRIYLTGQSLGGWGTWDLIEKKPYFFAAAIPVCGGANPNGAALIAHLPIWAFHGELDKTVPVELSREIVAAIDKLGGKIKYTEYKGAEHNIWDRAYNEAGLVEWLFSQRR